MRDLSRSPEKGGPQTPKASTAPQVCTADSSPPPRKAAGFVESPEIPWFPPVALIDSRIDPFAPEVYFFLYHPLCLSIGRKGAPALPSKEDLVLYHPLLVCRDQQNQPLPRPSKGDLVLYRPSAR